MLRKVKFNNFYSFKDEQEINFLAKKKKTYDYFQSKSGDQITKIAGFIGGNASGKTNAMRLFSFLSHFVTMSSKSEDELGLDIAYKTYFNKTESSNFYVEFEINDLIFYYEFFVKQNNILKEELYVKKIGKGSRKIMIFCRNHNEIKGLNENYFSGFSMNFLKNIRSDVSLIAFLKAHYNIEIINTVFDYFSGFKFNISESGKLNSAVYQVKAIELYLNDKALKEEVESFIRYFDIGLSGFEIKKEIKGGKRSYSVEGVHQTKEKSPRLDFNYESRGTKSLFFILAYILSALKNNNVVIIDEIETGLHPEALNKLLGYFIMENGNRRAQLIFSSHSLGFMNKLDMHQLNLVEKDKEGRSKIYRLNQVDGVRADENFLSKYMSGSYGAFPKIRI